MLKHSLTAAAKTGIMTGIMTGVLAAVLASPAFAQQPPTAKPDNAAQRSMSVQSTATRETFVQSQHATDWRGSKLMGATVYGAGNASIGEVNDVLIGNDGKVRALVIGVGGFLGVGEKNVAIPLDALSIARKPNSNAIDKIAVSYSKDDLTNAPKFAYYEPAKAQTTGSGVADKIKSLDPMNKTDSNK
jgi:hypothetical protein